MDPVQNKKDVFFFLHPGGLDFLQAPSLLGWTPAQPMTSSASMLLRTFVGEDPGGDGPLHRKVLGVAYRPAVDPAQVLPICQLAARVLTVSDLRMAYLVSH